MNFQRPFFGKKVEWYTMGRIVYHSTFLLPHSMGELTTGELTMGELTMGELLLSGST